ncbi:YlbG family protein [Oceanobacillus sp. J11TS1]|uniref:YlbG family protein n=1 Tax=Oceanobacillus sp. J11TS1 TaxID=2807191 RepID=UPI001B243DDA|nr:DUF2129 domain-containing protein [Oceanobacillus sp. J11TS1]GIO22319.1 UPF0298 protein [Oceanobacillus sp. J11TS1]
MMVERQGIVVWFQHMKNVRQLKKHGHLIHVSKKHRYAIIYVNRDDMDAMEKKFNQFSFVSKVERSQKPFISTNYENAKPDKAKQYDYKMGI